MDLALIPISRNQNSQLRYNPICIWDKDISGTVHSFSMKSSGTLGNCLFVIGKKGTIFVDSIDITVLQSVLFLRMALIFFFAILSCSGVFLLQVHRNVVNDSFKSKFCLFYCVSDDLFWLLWTKIFSKMKYFSMTIEKNVQCYEIKNAK